MKGVALGEPWHEFPTTLADEIERASSLEELNKSIDGQVLGVDGELPEKLRRAFLACVALGRLAGQD